MIVTAAGTRLAQRNWLHRSPCGTEVWCPCSCGVVLLGVRETFLQSWRVALAAAVVVTRPSSAIDLNENIVMSSRNSLDVGETLLRSFSHDLLE